MKSLPDRMGRLRARVLALGLVSGAFTSSAHANGLVTHTDVTDRASNLVANPELRTLMLDTANVESRRNGSIYPDTGYALSHPYGEWSHWEGFIQPYVQYIRAQHGAPPYTDPVARARVAFLMGVASHSMADQVFDMLFMTRTRDIDGAITNLDVGSDTWLITETGRKPVPNGMMPWSDALTVTQSAMGPAVTEEILRSATDRTLQGHRLVIAFASRWYGTYWREMRWAATHYLDETVPGSFPFLERSIARYWDVLYKRLRNDPPSVDDIVAQWPAPNETNVGVRANHSEARVVVVYGYGLVPSTVNTSNIRLLDPNNNPVPIDVYQYGVPEPGCSISMIPTRDLAYKTQYRVEIGTGVRLVTDVPLPGPITFTFTTRCAPGMESDCPPLPPTWTPPANPPLDPLRPDTGVTDSGAQPDVAVAPDDVSDAGTQDGGLGAEPSSRASCQCSLPTMPRRSWLGATGFLVSFLLVCRRKRS